MNTYIFRIFLVKLLRLIRANFALSQSSRNSQSFSKLFGICLFKLCPRNTELLFILFKIINHIEDTQYLNQKTRFLVLSVLDPLLLFLNRLVVVDIAGDPYSTMNHCTRFPRLLPFFILAIWKICSTPPASTSDFKCVPF